MEDDVDDSTKLAEPAFKLLSRNVNRVYCEVCLKSWDKKNRKRAQIVKLTRRILKILLLSGHQLIMITTRCSHVQTGRLMLFIIANRGVRSFGRRITWSHSLRWRNLAKMTLLHRLRSHCCNPNHRRPAAAVCEKNVFIRPTDMTTIRNNVLFVVR